MKADPKIVEELYTHGLSQNDIATRLCCSRSLIDTVMRNNGISARTFEQACHNKIRLTDSMEESIRTSYQSGLPLNDVMCEHSVSVKVLQRVLKPIRRSISESNRIVTQRRKHILNQNQLDIIYGTLLGDASLVIDGRSIAYSVRHCTRQAGYVDHTHDVIGHGSVSWITQNSGFSIGSRVRTYKYRNKAALRDIWDVVMIGGKKSVNSEWISKITPAAMAYWFMDDGSSVRVGRMKQYVRVTFATYCFSIAEIELLLSVLRNFGLKATVDKRKQGPSIRLSQSSSTEFMKLVEPTISLIPCLQYKIKYRGLQINTG